MIRVELILKDKMWTKFVEIARLRYSIKKLLSSAIKLLGYKIKGNTTVEVSVTLANDREVSSLNRKYRNIDRPTNVLSFPIYEKEFIKYLEKEKYLLLGDIVLSLETIKNESVDQNKIFWNHLMHMIVHSVLHLLGFDHMCSGDAKKMRHAEIALLDEFATDI